MLHLASGQNGLFKIDWVQIMRNRAVLIVRNNGNGRVSILA